MQDGSMLHVLFVTYFAWHVGVHEPLTVAHIVLEAQLPADFVQVDKQRPVVASHRH